MQRNSDEGAREFLLEIVHCSNVSACLDGHSGSHPCHRIVASQRSRSIEVFQVPEPWRGRLLEASLLFLSSNPSISETEEYPTGSWQDQKIEAYFDRRFERSIVDGIRTRQRDGSYSKSVAFWREVRARATELYERPVTPGRDYALTEVVHCKSRKNDGVEQALNECSKRYLSRVLSYAEAKVVICLGELVKRVVAKKFDIPLGVQIYGPAAICGKFRYFVFSAQPGSNKPRKFSTTLSEQGFTRLRGILKA